MNELKLSWKNVLAPLIVAVIVGMASSYVTASVQMGKVKTRLSQAEAQISRLRNKSHARRKGEFQMRERIIRLETKIDLLLETQGIDPQDPENYE